MTLAYKKYESPEAGSGSLVILHGLFGAGENWQSIAGALSARQDVYTFDLPGHGESSRIPGLDSLAYPDMARAVIETIEFLKVKNPTILGHSMGGKVAMLCALYAPELVKSLVVADIAPKIYPPQADHREVLSVLENLDPAKFGGRTEIDAALLPYISELGMRRFLQKSLLPRGEGGFEWKFNTGLLLSQYSRIGEWKEEFTRPDQVPSQLPALFIKGALSDYIDVAVDQARILAYFPRAEFATVENAGHWVHVDNKVKFLTLVNDFTV